jgi:hypothetical protein
MWRKMAVIIAINQMAANGNKICVTNNQLMKQCEKANENTMKIQHQWKWRNGVIMKSAAHRRKCGNLSSVKENNRHLAAAKRKAANGEAAANVS